MQSEITPKGKRTRVTPAEAAERKQRVFEYLDAHRDELKYATKGYKARISANFTAETGMTVPPTLMHYYVAEYRQLHDCPLQYHSKYYKPRETVNGLTSSGIRSSYTPKAVTDTERPLEKS